MESHHHHNQQHHHHQQHFVSLTPIAPKQNCGATTAAAGNNMIPGGVMDATSTSSISAAVGGTGTGTGTPLLVPGGPGGGVGVSVGGAPALDGTGQQLLPTDVFCGRGGYAQHHVGNKNYLKLIQQYHEDYSKLSSKKQKTDFSRMLVGVFRNLGIRFVKRDPKTKTWKEVDVDQTRRKIAQALREAETTTTTTTMLPDNTTEVTASTTASSTVAPSTVVAPTATTISSSIANNVSSSLVVPQPPSGTYTTTTTTTEEAISSQQQRRDDTSMPPPSTNATITTTTTTVNQPQQQPQQQQQVIGGEMMDSMTSWDKELTSASFLIDDDKEATRRIMEAQQQQQQHPQTTASLSSKILQQNLLLQQQIQKQQEAIKNAKNNLNQTSSAAVAAVAAAAVEEDDDDPLLAATNELEEKMDELSFGMGSMSMMSQPQSLGDADIVSLSTMDFSIPTRMQGDGNGTRPRTSFSTMDFSTSIGGGGQQTRPSFASMDFSTSMHSTSRMIAQLSSAANADDTASIAGGRVMSEITFDGCSVMGGGVNSNNFCWYYYLTKDPNGKKDGWYPYDADMQEPMEAIYSEYICAKMAPLATTQGGQSSKTTKTNKPVKEKYEVYCKRARFWYDIDLRDMTQTNRWTGKTRHIYRTTNGNAPPPPPKDSRKNRGIFLKPSVRLFT